MLGMTIAKLIVHFSGKDTTTNVSVTIKQLILHKSSSETKQVVKLLTEITRYPLAASCIICWKKTSAVPQTGGRHIRGLLTCLGPASYSTHTCCVRSTTTYRKRARRIKLVVQLTVALYKLTFFWGMELLNVLYSSEAVMGSTSPEAIAPARLQLRLLHHQRWKMDSKRGTLLPYQISSKCWRVNVFIVSWGQRDLVILL